MRYTYRCVECRVDREVEHPMVDDPKIRCGCGRAMSKVITGGVGFIIRGSAPSKDIRIGHQRDRRYREMGRRQARSHKPASDLIPNVQHPENGKVEVCDTWAHAEMRAADWGVLKQDQDRAIYRA